MNPPAHRSDPTPSAIAGGVLVPEGPSPPAGPSRSLRQAIGSATLLAALVTLATGAGLIAFYHRYLDSEARERIVAQTVPYGQALGAAMAHRVAVLQGFEAFLKIQPDTQRDLEALQRYTADLQQTTRGIRALQLIRGGRIIAVAPLEGNEAALGLDLRHHPDPQVRKKLAQSESSDVITVTGPRALAQGGQGLVLRRRFTRPQFSGYDLAALVLDLQPLLEEAGLVDPVGVRVAIRDSAGQVLFGPADLGAHSPVEVEVQLPDDIWRLQAVPAEGWSVAIRERLLLFALAVVTIGVLLVAVVHLVASRQARLVGAVAERTRSLRDAVEELSDLAAQREQMEVQLRQSQRLESLGSLAGGIAHDFNNLLTVILGSVSLAREEIPPTSEAGVDLLTAERAAHRAKDLTRKLLTFARRQSVEAQVVDLNDLVVELQTIIPRLISELVRIVEELAPGLWTVFADPGQLEQVVTNLVVNARDAMPDGGTLTIRTRNVELRAGAGAGATDVLAPGEYVRLEVEDTGSGIPPAVLHRVFEPFFTTKELGQGTGLGLATVYGIVRQSGGDVTLSSQVGVGTLVTIHLPRSRPGQVTRREAEPVELESVGGGETVLLVEDEAAVRQVTVRILTEGGYHVIAAEEGESALRRLGSAQRIDLLVADVVTPGMGGRALAERMLERDPATRVLLVSGYIADVRLEELLARPGVAFLPKPFTASQLQRAVRQLLDAPRRG